MWMSLGIGSVLPAIVDGDLDDAGLDQLAELGRVLGFRRKATIFSDGEPYQGMFVVLDGLARDLDGAQLRLPTPVLHEREAMRTAVVAGIRNYLAPRLSGSSAPLVVAMTGASATPYALRLLEALAAASSRPAALHLKLETGTHRQGVPLDEALSRVVVDFSGRPGLEFNVEFPRARIGAFDVDLFIEFFQGFVNHAAVTLHVDNLRGHNAHHIAETVFKAFGRALRMALAPDPRMAGITPSTKGSL